MLKPVSVFGFLAKVLPGSRKELEMIPVADSVWLISVFDVNMRVSIFWHRSTKTTQTLFGDYRPADEALAHALAGKYAFPTAPLAPVPAFPHDKPAGK